jgi:rubrerythrin
MASLDFDPLERFAEIERLVSKIYYRFSHLFFSEAELRDFWWGMAGEEEQHAAILLACKALIQNYDDEKVDASINRESADRLAARLTAYLARGTPSLTIDEAFKIALDTETSEIEAIYGKLLELGGPKIAQTMQNLGVPASIQRQRLKATLRRFCKDVEIIAAAERF